MPYGHVHFNGAHAIGLRVAVELHQIKQIVGNGGVQKRNSHPFEYLHWQPPSLVVPKSRAKS
jgi:hypothetical protein